MEILKKKTPQPTIVFCNKTSTSHFVANLLNDHDIRHEHIYGGLNQKVFMLLCAKDVWFPGTSPHPMHANRTAEKLHSINRDCFIGAFLGLPQVIFNLLQVCTDLWGIQNNMRKPANRGENNACVSGLEQVTIGHSGRRKNDSRIKMLNTWIAWHVTILSHAWQGETASTKLYKYHVEYYYLAISPLSTIINNSTCRWNEVVQTGFG